MSGVKLPLCHCAFSVCSWTSTSPPCARWACRVEGAHRGEWISFEKRQKLDSHVYGCCNNDGCLKHHIVTKRLDVLVETCGMGNISEDSFDYYCEAMKWREEQKMPNVGISIDRRVFNHVVKELGEDALQNLICTCCAQVRTRTNGPHGEIAYISVEEYFNGISADSFWSQLGLR